MLSSQIVDRIKENKLEWNMLMDDLFNCVGLERGKSYKHYLTPEEEQVIKELDQCNREFEFLKREAAKNGINLGTK